MNLQNNGPEILAPAGSPEALRAAVFSGADAVYFGASAFNARMHAANFSGEDLKDSIRFCHERGVACHVTLNTLVSQKEMSKALQTAQEAICAGADALIVQDPGLAYEIRKRSDIPLHASTQMTIHNLDGVLFAEQMGFRRAVLSRELSRKELEYLALRSPIELEVFVHGALCMCYSGQCYLSSLIGRRSGNRGECAQPCRLPWKDGYILSLKDLCLLKYVPELAQMGISSLKIEGRMKSPEYVSAVTAAYAAAKRGKEWSAEQEEYLAGVFSRSGFTDGYYTGHLGGEMFGVRSETSVHPSVPSAEYPRLPLDVTVKACPGALCVTALCDGYSAEGTLPLSPARNRPTTEADLRAAFDALGNTPYYVSSFSVNLPEGSFVPVSAVKQLRRDLLQRLTAMRTVGTHSFRSVPLRSWEHRRFDGRREGFFLHPERIGADTDLDFFWIPLSAVKEGEGLCRSYPGKIGIILPRILSDTELPQIERLIGTWKSLGVTDALCGNVGHLILCHGQRLTPHGDVGLNVYNPASRDLFLRQGMESVTLSFELNAAQQRDLTTEKTGVIVYGRLPSMIFRNCLKHRHGAEEYREDRIGKNFLLTCDFGCRNQLWNADVLWLAEKDRSGVGFQRFLFTDESEQRIRQVLSAYKSGAAADVPFTRGYF